MNKKKLVWVTDIHLDSIHNQRKTTELFDHFCQEVNKQNPETVIITGDISNALQVEEHLKMLNAAIPAKILFVLGNHDFYRGRIDMVRPAVGLLNSEKLTYLSTLSIGKVPLTQNTAVVGHDGWYDGLYANWFAPGTVVLNDYTLVGELRESYLKNNGHVGLFAELQRLAIEGANHVKHNLRLACDSHKTVIVATHVPPFPENSVYRGKRSDWRWLPTFSSKRMGDAILEVAKDYPDNEIVVLCGHSHGNAEYHPLPNVTSYTGFSEYGYPWLSIKTLEVE